MNSSAPVYSMTAFARSQHQITTEQETIQFSWELRSVNHRYLELHFRMNDALRHLEMPIRSLIQSHLARGKLDITLNLKQNSHHSIALNHTRLAELNQAIDEVQHQLPQASHLNPLEILKWPGILIQEPDQAAFISDSLDQTLLQTLEQTLNQLQRHRQSEGAALRSVIEQRCHAIEHILQELQPLLPRIQQTQTEKLRQKLASLHAQVEEPRLFQEIALLAQKIDISEEIDRLNLHLKEVQRVLNSGQAIGRRLDFLMQELNREANTLGAKSTDTRTSQASVELKVLIEQMREQIQNIE